LNFKSIVLPVVISDCFANFIEPPLLLSGVSSPSSLGHGSVTMHLTNSVEWKLRHNVEWPVDVESKLFVQTLGLSFSLLVKIQNLPSLVSSVGSTCDLNSLSFNILGLHYI
jgi:hypothetical protein